MIPSDILIFGAGSHGRKLASSLQTCGIKVHAFVTSTAGSQEEVNGIPLYSAANLPEEMRTSYPIACGIFNRSDAYAELSDFLEKNGLSNILWPWDYYPYAHKELGWCYWLDPKPRQLKEWQEMPSYQKVVSHLSDEESRSTVDRIISFRTGTDLSLSSFSSSDPQYFNRLTLQALPSDRPTRYLDVGAFDGDTLKALCRLAPVSTAILVEPDPRNYRALVSNLRHLVSTNPSLQPLALPIGAGNEHGTFLLSGDGESVTFSDSISSDSLPSQSVTVVPLDDLLPNGTVDFIKIDVEGHDWAAIQGMEALIQRSRPIIAVSLYHRPNDIIELPLALMNLLSSLPYLYYIRQHMKNSFETVFYAIPDARANFST
jgi:FkbM family methyltransferase